MLFHSQSINSHRSPDQSIRKHSFVELLEEAFLNQSTNKEDGLATFHNEEQVNDLYFLLEGIANITLNLLLDRTLHKVTRFV